MLEQYKIVRPVDVERDENGKLILMPDDDTTLINYFGEAALANLKVRRIGLGLGSILGVGNTDTAFTELIRVHSPQEEYYEALAAEVGPGEIMHHPV